MTTETASGVTVVTHPLVQHKLSYLCLLYTSDAADE